MPKRRWTLFVAAFVAASLGAKGQVYSPLVTKVGQVETHDLRKTAEDIYRAYNAHTDREKAEAIWRYYLTDGRFVAPGIFYHIAGWAYEEPVGQVLDPIKLLNSYGFGLCYQDGPLMAATYRAGGFKDARVWFLTGHTVAEVFYDGQYHYFDSDMLGYNPVGDGPVKERLVASVYQLEHDGNIMLKNVTGPKSSNPHTVDYPWYPADVRAGDMADIAGLFTSTSDNYLYAYQRYPQGHTMDFVLRPGERMTRYYKPTPAGLFYLPYTYNGDKWNLLPDFAQFNLPVEEGPHSEKDKRSWATGKLEYRPDGNGDAAVHASGHDESITFSMPSPYVVIDANFKLSATLPNAEDTLTVATSIDGGQTWTNGMSTKGPFQGPWEAHAAELPASHGRLNAVSGSYGYLVRFSLHSADGKAPSIGDFFLTTRFQLNPRTLPELTAGNNRIAYRAGNEVREELPQLVSQYKETAHENANVEYVSQGGEGYLINTSGKNGEVVFELAASGENGLDGFDAGGRFLDLRSGIAPSKFTAETRKVAPWPADDKDPGSASLAWSTSPIGPWNTLWAYNPQLTWLDHQPIPQVLRWPEVDRKVREVPPGTRHVYVRYQIHNLAIDQVRLATIQPIGKPGPLQITHIWEVDGKEGEFRREVVNSQSAQQYDIAIPTQGSVENVALILECPRASGR
jgi:hypothetical protein